MMMKQDDPDKCTAEKMVRLGLARCVRRAPRRSLVLNPFEERYLVPSDGRLADSVTAVDCSWNLAGGVFLRRFGGVGRRLPPLLAGNPVNYSKVNKLTTAEAVSGALFVLGFRDRSLELLSKFRWGHTFYELNRNLLEDYSGVRHAGDVEGVAAEYGLAF